MQGPYIDLYFFDVTLIKHCTLHVLNLKMVLAANGSVLWHGSRGVETKFADLRSLELFLLALRSMLLHQGVFGIVANRTVAGYKDALQAAYADFGAWRRVMKVGCSQKKFNYNGLFSEEYGAFMNAKGYNARVLSEWLRDVLTRVRTRDWPDREEKRTLGNYRDIEDDERSWMAEVAMNLDLKHPQTVGVRLCPKLRRGLTRYFGLTERASRFLKPGCTTLDMASVPWCSLSRSRTVEQSLEIEKAGNTWLQAYQHCAILSTRTLVSMMLLNSNDTWEEKGACVGSDSKVACLLDLKALACT